MSSVVQNTIDLLYEVKALKEERDALVEAIKMLGRMGQNICPVCAHYNHGEGSNMCIPCPKLDNFKWRGLVKEG